MDRRGFLGVLLAACALPSLVVDLFLPEPPRQGGFTAIQYRYRDGLQLAPPHVPQDGKWHHYAATIHPDGTETWYVDGREVEW